MSAGFADTAAVSKDLTASAWCGSMVAEAVVPAASDSAVIVARISSWPPGFSRPQRPCFARFPFALHQREHAWHRTSTPMNERSLIDLADNKEFEFIIAPQGNEMNEAAN